MACGHWSSRLSAGKLLPHYDGRRNDGPRIIGSSRPVKFGGVAIEDWTGVHFKGGEIHRVHSFQAGAQAYSMRAFTVRCRKYRCPAEFLDPLRPGRMNEHFLTDEMMKAFISRWR